MRNIGVVVILALAAASFSLLCAKDAPDGPELFRARCGTCHGQKGEGLASAKVPPIRKTAMSIQKLSAFITEGRSGTIVHYTPIVNLDIDEARAIAAHVRSLK